MKCFYHSADLDGHCSGAIIKHAYPDCEMFGINYGDKFPWNRIVKDEKVFMVDFTLQPFEDMEKLNNICKLHWIDHHKTALDEAHKRGFLASGGQLLAIDKAGCELTWEYVHSKYALTPDVIYLLGRYDVWDHSSPYVLPFQYGMRNIKNTLPDNQALWHDLFDNNPTLYNKIMKNGKLLIEYEETQNEKFCNRYAFETELNGLKAICANKGLANSKLFNSVYDPEKHDLMITFVRLRLPANKWTVSLYSTKENIDCGKIAKSFGGGGHKGAAGFQCEELPFKI